jgi:DNA-binding transcriptional regulator YbjK
VAPADGRPYGDEIAGRLIEASFDLVAEGGWAVFSLRAVADAIGAAGSAASHRFGDRSGLVAAVGEAALLREAAEMNRFLPGVTTSGAGELAALLNEWLEQRARRGRRLGRMCAELMRVSYRDPALQGFGARWLDLTARWIGRLYPKASDDAARILAGALAAEAPFRLLLADDPEFRLVSQESLGRTVALALGAQGPPPFWLQRGLALPPAEPPLGLAGAKAAIVEAAARLIEDDGVLAVTHREIARRCGASLSSLTYHFRSLDDLIRQGFERLFADPGRPPPAAVYEMALQALSDPALAPLALVARRRLAQDAPGPQTSDLDVLGRRETGALLAIAFTLAGAPAPAMDS